MRFVSTHLKMTSLAIGMPSSNARSNNNKKSNNNNKIQSLDIASVSRSDQQEQVNTPKTPVEHSNTQNSHGDVKIKKKTKNGGGKIRIKLNLPDNNSKYRHTTRGTPTKWYDAT